MGFIITLKLGSIIDECSNEMFNYEYVNMFHNYWMIWRNINIVLCHNVIHVH